MPALIRSAVPIVPRVLSLGDFDRQEREMLDVARRKAAAIIAQARAEAQASAAAIEAESRQRGIAEGRAAGEAAARAEATQKALIDARERIDTLTNAMKSALQRFEREKLSLLAVGEARLTELALAAARRVCKIEVGRSGHAALANARELVARMKHEGDLEIALSSDDLESLNAAAPTLLTSLRGLQHVKLTADPSLKPGACLARSARGEIDAGIELQLDRLAEALLGPPAAAESFPLPTTDGGHE